MLDSDSFSSTDDDDNPIKASIVEKTIISNELSSLSIRKNLAPHAQFLQRSSDKLLVISLNNYL